MPDTTLPPEPPAEPGRGRAAEIQAALEAAEDDAAEHARLTRRARSLTGPTAEAELEIASARRILDVESRDVERLESFSPTRIWAVLHGTRDVELDKERAEQQAAEYAVAQAEARHAQLQAELTELRLAIDRLGDVQARRQQVLADKDRWLQESGSPVGAELADLAATLADRAAAAREVAEAMQAADRARHALSRAGSVLGSARSWSTYDTFFGGGMIGDMVKYDKIDQAQRLMRDADTALRVLSRELADVGMSGVGGVEVTEMTRVFDVWFDNIFSDWSVRNRIDEAASRLARAHRPVGEVRQRLAERATALDEELGRLARRRHELLQTTSL